MATTKTTKKKRKPGEPSPAQLRARRKFAAMAKARAKAARAAKRAAGIKAKPKKRNAAGYVDEQGRFRPIRSSIGADGRPSKKPYSAKKAGEKSTYSTTAKAKSARASKRSLSTSSDVLGRSVKKRLLAKNGKKSNSPGIAKAKQQRKEFLGSPARKVTSTTVPKGARPKGALSKMGRLMRIKVKGRTWMDFKGVPTLARDGRDKMFITGKDYKITAKGKRRNPDGFEDLGEITHIEYAATKAHLDGYPVTYVHAMGEEGGEKPHAVVNDEGLLLIEGGDYTITARGIEN